MSTRKASTDVHEFEGMFLGFHVHFKVTSVIGHVFRLIFLPKLSPLKSSNPSQMLNCQCYLLRAMTDSHPWFCVQRYLQINTFKPEKFWAVRPYIIQKGYELQLEWERNKLFDYDVAVMFQKLVMEDGILEVTEMVEKQESKSRPFGLNTVNLLKVASSALSYPRTESTAYPSSFDFRGTLRAQVNNPTWASYVQRLLADGYQKPRSGTDVGDHPPVTPLRSATEDMLGNDAGRLYEYICTHFIGTVSPDCKYVR
ncbi:hypothetical protein PRUPE_1G173500 [Prunus persica]|uniref:DNA topoisomerase n=1 Tax=Prunus persica TaxID=3760 RepID=M5XGT8_PRUPE|nr:hypothetical protein PRUPE_1G173500 [Prunus persica]